MPYAFGHLTFSWICGKGAELNKKFKLDRWMWFFLLFGSIFPDSDFLLDWFFKTELHRSFSHSLLMAVLSFLIVFLIVSLLKKKFKNIKPFAYALAFGLGISTHLVADMVLGWPGIALFWPLKIRFWLFGMGNSNYVSLPINLLTKDQLVRQLKFAILDMGLGVAWIGYLFFRKKIKSF